MIIPPFFLALDAASYVTGMSIFNKEGQLLGHKTVSIDKKKIFYKGRGIKARNY